MKTIVQFVKSRTISVTRKWTEMSKLIHPQLNFSFISLKRAQTSSTNGFNKLKTHPLSELFYSQFHTNTKTKKPRERGKVAERETQASFTCAREAISSQVESKVLVVVLCLSEFLEFLYFIVFCFCYSQPHWKCF